MALSELHLKTIEEVAVCFCIQGDGLDPDIITSSTGIEPDSCGRKGEVRRIGVAGNQREHERLSGTWLIESRSKSKDVNEQMRELLSRLEGAGKTLPQGFERSFIVVWKGSYLYAGSGPQYDADVIAGIANLHAALEHDIYQVDRDTD